MWALQAEYLYFVLKQKGNAIIAKYCILRWASYQQLKGSNFLNCWSVILVILILS